MIRSIAIYSNYAHHSQNGGYKQVLRYTKPVAVFGIDFNKTNSRFALSYYFVHEFVARIKTLGLKFDLVHVLYGEEYFRFSRMLFPRKKLVVTFHQTPVILERELSRGDFNGRVSGLMHRLTRNRLRKLDVAVVMTEEQAVVARKYIPAQKVHVIPLGVELDHLNRLYQASRIERQPTTLITVGEWQRDWELYFQVARVALVEEPSLRFVLVNKRLDPIYRQVLPELPNVSYKESIADKELYELYLQSSAMFLPLKSISGSNAANEGLALGCPIFSNLVLSAFPSGSEFLFNFKDPASFVAGFRSFLKLGSEQRNRISQQANASVQHLSWERVSNKLIELYNSIE